jgi:hypothetical protein
MARLVSDELLSLPLPSLRLAAPTRQWPLLPAERVQVSAHDAGGDACAIGGSASSRSTGSRIKSVRQQGTTLNLDSEDGGTWEIRTAETTSSVMVRDKNHQLDYAD